MEKIIRDEGAVPATVGILGGEICVGMCPQSCLLYHIVDLLKLQLHICVKRDSCLRKSLKIERATPHAHHA